MTWRLLARGGAVIAVAAGGSGQRSLVVAVATRAVQCGSGGGGRWRPLRVSRTQTAATWRRRARTDPATHGARGRSLPRSLAAGQQASEPRASPPQAPLGAPGPRSHSGKGEGERERPARNFSN